MRFLTQRWFLLVIGLGAAHQLTQKGLHLSLPLLDNYLDPLLCMPILLHLRRWEKNLGGPSDAFPALPNWEIFLWFVLTAILAEIIFPALSKRFTGDSLDAVAYAAGSLLYAWFINPKKEAT